MAKKFFGEFGEMTGHSISDFLFDEEASIPKSKLLAIGSLMVVLSIALGAQDVFADHSSHKSHSSHSSHSSGSSRSNHGSHESHVSHSSHTSGSSHSNHSNHSSGTSVGSSSGGNTYSSESGADTSGITGSTGSSTTTLEPVADSMLQVPQVLPDTIPIK